ncbi:MAG: 30S ribosomal protein S2, partial [Candidatus Iainarchaeum archaeon]
TKFKHGDMKRFIYKVRKDGLNVLNVQTLENRIKLAAKFLAGFEPGSIVVVSRKLYGQTAVKQFAKLTGAKCFTGRFVPGTFTNPQAQNFVEPGVLIVTGPNTDAQAIEEANKVRIPVVALASTDNSLRRVDFVIPVNNKGRKSIALVYWLLARELLKERGDIKSYSEFKEPVESFEFQIAESQKKKIRQISRRKRKRK